MGYLLSVPQEGLCFGSLNIPVKANHRGTTFPVVSSGTQGALVSQAPQHLSSGFLVILGVWEKEEALTTKARHSPCPGTPQKYILANCYSSGGNRGKNTWASLTLWHHMQNHKLWGWKGLRQVLAQCRLPETSELSAPIKQVHVL